MNSDSNILKSDWVYDTGAAESIISKRDILTNYMLLSQSMILRAANETPLITYKKETYKICMKFMNIFIKNIYFAPKAIFNLLSHEALINSGYWAAP